LAAGGQSISSLLGFYNNSWETVNCRMSGRYETKNKNQLGVDDWHKRKKGPDSLTRYMEDALIRGVDIKASGHG